MQAPGMRGEACSSQRRKGGIFPSSSLTHPLSSASLYAIQLISRLPSSLCLSLPRFKDACGLLAGCLSLCLPGGDRGWLVSGGSPGDRLWVFTLRRCCLCGSGLVTLGLFSTETGLSLLRFRPLLCFLRHQRHPHTQGCVYLGVGACGTKLHLGLNYCDILHAVPLKVHFSTEKHVSQWEHQGLCNVAA